MFVAHSSFFPHGTLSNRVRRWGMALLIATPFIACAASSGPSGNGESGGNSDGESSGTSGSGSTSGQSGGVASSSGFSTHDSAPSPDAGRPPRCDDAGHCSCINVASIGHEGVWGPCSTDNTSEFQSWLNSQSTAHVDSYDTTKPTLTADFLNQYDVIILQWMVANGQKGNDGAPWVFSSAEIAALQTWINNGGGVIALDGYQATDPSQIFDITATNQLLSFADMQFNKDITLTNPDGLAYCWGDSVPLGEPIATAPNTTTFGAWSQATGSLGLHVSDVGVLDGRSIAIKNPANVVVDEQWQDSAGTHVAAAHEAIGKGHVVFYGDEWITYTGEWTGVAVCLTNPYDASTNPCYMNSPAEVFQIAQYWYNSIKYAGSAVQCAFTITSPGIIY